MSSHHHEMRIHVVALAVQDAVSNGMRADTPRAALNWRFRGSQLTLFGDGGDAALCASAKKLLQVWVPGSFFRTQCRAPQTAGRSVKAKEPKPCEYPEAPDILVQCYDAATKA